MEDWLAEVEKLQAAKQDAGPNGFTKRDFARSLGTSQSTAGKKIRDLFDAGRIKCVGNRKSVCVDGVMRNSPVFALVK